MTRRLAALLLLFVGVAGCQADTAGRCRMGRATELPLDLADGHLVTSATLNGTPTKFILDTGAQVTTLTSASASRLRLSLQPFGYAEGVGGTRTGYRFVAKTFQIGSLRGRNFELMANEMVLSKSPSSVDGLFGDDFLAAYDLDLDLPEHKAILFAKVGECTSPAAALTGTLYGLPMVASSRANDHRPFVRVNIDGKTLTALVDSGAPHTTLFRNAAGRLGLRIADLKTDRHLHVGGIGPDKPEAVRHVMTAMSVGDLTIQHLPIAIVDQHSFDDADMLLGLDFLRRVHVWYGFSSHTLIMQFPPLPSPPA